MLKAPSMRSKSDRNDADDFVLLAVEREALADGGWRGAELAFPEACADERDGGGADLVVGRNEGAPGDGLYAENREEIGSYQLGLRLFSRAESREAERKAAGDGHGGERLILFLPIEEIRIGDRAGVEIGFALVNGDELIGLRIRQRIQQHAVDNGEERGVCADGEGESEDGDGGEGWGFRQHAQSESEVLQHRGHWQPPCGRESRRYAILAAPRLARWDTKIEEDWQLGYQSQCEIKELDSVI